MLRVYINFFAIIIVNWIIVAMFFHIRLENLQKHYREIIKTQEHELRKLRILVRDRNNHE